MTRRVPLWRPEWADDDPRWDGRRANAGAKRPRLGADLPLDTLDELSPTQAADLLEVDRHAIYQAIRRGRLPARRFGVKEWRITRAACDEYAAERYRRGER